ncbi:pyridoxamine 5'-phosphate oxidase family protein [Andreprevotia chitinilytica]|uniref:pyridoxamine 5'-phosphate oxidase family protein n=1 Tax=Andreprevotia chitinilytica TaxID=396808 RepID=UPI00055104DF|nr:pyridoxamine 5'-phosphate oxidase family protein [Andreprevotia chitinilytica]
MTTQPNKPPSDRTRIRRIAENANYERDTLYSIIDAAYLCHVAFHDEKGTHCIPTACWREDNHLYIHGSNGGRLIKLLAKGTQASVAITHLDGLVLARSAFNHSMNYRSAVIYGQFEQVPGEAAKSASLDVFMDKLAPGRKDEARKGNSKELAATTVMRISLDEAAAKIRVGGPNDDDEDMAIPVWAGVLPFVTVAGTPEPAADLLVEAPAYVREWATAEM